MNVDTLMQLLVTAHRLCGHRDYVVSSASLLRMAQVEATLAGKRKIIATMAGKLGKFLDVSPAVFVPT